MDREQAKKRVKAIWDGPKPKPGALALLSGLYNSCFEQGRDLVPANVFNKENPKTRELLIDRMEKHPKIKKQDKAYLKKLSDGNDKLIGELIYAGEYGATDLTYEIYENFYLDADSSVHDEAQNMVADVAAEQGVSAEEIESEIHYVARTALADGVEKALDEQARDTLQEWAVEMIDALYEATGDAEMTPAGKAERAMWDWERKSMPLNVKALQVIVDKWKLDGQEKDIFEKLLHERIEKYNKNMHL